MSRKNIYIIILLMATLILLAAVYAYYDQQLNLIEKQIRNPSTG